MFIRHGLIKIEIALCTGKKRFDKREVMKKKDMEREAERAMRRNR
ncbi:MAG: SsrA-binding protein [Opitutales bacterium]